jgi:two-component system sensor histidine kinase ChvG
VTGRNAKRWPRRGLRERLFLTSSIRRRIVVINGLGLIMLVGGVLYLNQFRQGLLDMRVEALRTQGEIVAIAVAENAGLPDSLSVDPVRAALVLRRLTQPAGVRARLFDRAGRLIGDTRAFNAETAPIEAAPLPPPGAVRDLDALEWLLDLYGDYVEIWTPLPDLYKETPLAGISSDPEVYAALQGGVASTIRRNSENEQIVSVAVPVQRFKAVFGALVLSTEGGDIDRVVRDERSAIIVVFLIALLVSAGLSVLLAGTIATPLRKLADAAAKSGASGKRAIDPERVGFPDYGDRADEIGYLSSALREMTGALYSRLAAIERFAADVAHEIKNPLTSLRSAVETFRLARTDAQRERLLAVIEHDVRRLDRLVTDISNASRVDAELSREEMRPVDIPALLDAVVSVTRDGAEAKEVRLTQSAQPQLSVQGLEGRLGQVLRNLVDNAISFSPAGGAVRIVAQRAPGGGVEIAVEDDGPGVPPDKLDAVFERFWSERPDADGFGDHSGLGLSISRQIVEAHGGRIAAGNRADPLTGETLGARFTVFLP